MGAGRTSGRATWIAAALVAAAVPALVLCRTCACAPARGVRPAAVAGAFYPDSPRVLRTSVRRFLDEATPEPPEAWKDARPRALVVPHAGYAYSGATAAFAYKLLEGKPRPSRVVLIGPAHTTGLLGTCSVAGFAEYETPLGRVPVDVEAAARLVAQDPFRAMVMPHRSEHCLEVQLPFLQVLWSEPPPIVPILVGKLSPGQCRAAAAGLAELLDEQTLLIISTDFTHYGPRFGFTRFDDASGERLKERIRELDMGAVRQIEALDADGFRAYIARERPTICGRAAIQVVLELLAGRDDCQAAFLRWSNSGDRVGRYENCVSYVAMALYAPPGPLGTLRTAAAPPPEAEGPGALTEGDRRALLKLARRSLRRAVTERKVPPPADPDELPDRLRQAGAAFVTLKVAGQLRGCIGHVEAAGPLGACVDRVAALAAVRDSRFPPVQSDELDDIIIEISVMTPLEIIRGIDDVRVGRDGLVVRGKGRRGLLLPQVATEQGWAAREFLQRTCRKAGLPPDAWKDPDVLVYRFQAIVFSESDFEAE